MKKIDYDKLKIEYVTTDTSYRKLAEKYGVSDTMIKKKGRQGGWYEAKKAHQKEVNRQITQRITQSIVEEQVEMWKREENILSKVLDDIEANFRCSETPLAPRELQSVTQSIERLVNTRMKMEGIISAEQQRSFELQAERLKLERKRVELEAQRVEQGESDTDVVVVFPDEVSEEGWAD